MGLSSTWRNHWQPRRSWHHPLQLVASLVAACPWVTVPEQHQSANEVSLLFQHLSALRLPPIKTSAISPLPPRASIKRRSSHSAPPIPLYWCGNQPSALCFFSMLWSHNPTAARGIQTHSWTEHSSTFHALLVNLCDLSVVISILHRPIWPQQQPISVYFILSTQPELSKKKKKKHKKKKAHSVIQRAAVPDASIRIGTHGYGFLTTMWSTGNLQSKADCRTNSVVVKWDWFQEA